MAVRHADTLISVDIGNSFQRHSRNLTPFFAKMFCQFHRVPATRDIAWALLSDYNHQRIPLSGRFHALHSVRTTEFKPIVTKPLGQAQIGTGKAVRIYAPAVLP